MPETMISLDSQDEELAVFGSRDQHLRQVRDALGVKVLARHGEVRVEGEPDRVTGMVLDLKELKQILDREVVEPYDHRFLNYEVPELNGQIPTCENIVRVIWNLLEPKIVRGRLHKVRLYETPDLFAECRRNGAGLR